MTTATRTLVNRRGQSIVTNLSNLEAIESCQNGHDAFGLDLAQKAGRGLSPDQWWWVHKIALGRTAPQATAPAVNVKGVWTLFDNARRNKMKKPVLRIRFENRAIKISPAGARSKNAGCLYVASEYTYFGRITDAGEWCPAKESPGLVGVLQELAENPAEAAARYGQHFGSCCFCGLTLTDDRSVNVGYGPVCADHWGLPWG